MRRLPASANFGNGASAVSRPIGFCCMTDLPLVPYSYRESAGLVLIVGGSGLSERGGRGARKLFKRLPRLLWRLVSER